MPTGETGPHAMLHSVCWALGIREQVGPARANKEQFKISEMTRAREKQTARPKAPSLPALTRCARCLDLTKLGLDLAARGLDFRLDLAEPGLEFAALVLNLAQLGLDAGALVRELAARGLELGAAELGALWRKSEPLTVISPKDAACNPQRTRSGHAGQISKTARGSQHEAAPNQNFH